MKKPDRLDYIKGTRWVMENHRLHERRCIDIVDHIKEIVRKGYIKERDGVALYKELIAKKTKKVLDISCTECV